MSKIKKIGWSLLGSLLFIAEYLVIRAGVSNLVYWYSTQYSVRFDGMSTKEVMDALTIPNLLIGNMMVIFIFVLFHMKHKQASDMLMSFNKLSDVFNYAAIGLAVTTLMSFLITLIFKDMPVDINNNTTDIILGGEAGSFWLTALTAGLLSPISEELIYRSGVLGMLRKGMSNGWAIFLSALIFGIMHGTLVQGIYAFVIGLVFGIVVCKHDGNVLPSIIMHCIINTTSVFLSYLDMTDIWSMLWFTCTFYLIARAFAFFENKGVESKC